MSSICVEYIDHMGTDLTVVNAAKVSFANSSRWEKYDDDHCILSERDERLIYFLARGVTDDEWKTYIDMFFGNQVQEEDLDKFLHHIKTLSTHWVPFAHPTIQLRVKAPVPIRTQCFKHKIGFVESEESRRYISSRPELFVPEFKSRPIGNIKQGSGDLHLKNEDWKKTYETYCNKSIDMYEDMIKDGIAPEQARFILPQGVHINWVWTGSLAAYARYYIQRSDKHAQGENNYLADEIRKCIKPLFPTSWSALTGESRIQHVYDSKTKTAAYLQYV